MKILDSGTEPLENAAVLAWLERKSRQHEAEDLAFAEAVVAEQDKREPGKKTAAKEKLVEAEKALLKGRKMSQTARPANYVRSLATTKQHLSRSHHPHVSNPRVYTPNTTREANIRVFWTALMSRLNGPIESRYSAQYKAEELPRHKDQILDRMLQEQLSKELSDAEVLCLVNLAPASTADVLGACLEDGGDRYSWEEKEVMLELVGRVWRAQEGAPETVGANGVVKLEGQTNGTGGKGAGDEDRDGDLEMDEAHDTDGQTAAGADEGEGEERDAD